MSDLRTGLVEPVKMSDRGDYGIVVRLADGSWLHLVKTTTYCRNCDGGGGCMDCVGRYIHDECEVSCPVCEGSFEVATWEIHPSYNGWEDLTRNEVERVFFY